MQPQQFMNLIQTGLDQYAPQFICGILVLLLFLIRAILTLRRQARRQLQLVEESRERLTQVETELTELKNRTRPKTPPARRGNAPQPRRVEKPATKPATGPEPTSWTHGESTSKTNRSLDSGNRTNNCRNCGQQIKYSPAHAGRQMKCSSCRATVKLP